MSTGTINIELTGPRGAKGWTPVITGVSEGGRHLLLIDWTGGVNPKPTTGYLGENNLVADPAQALSLTGKGLANISQEPNADLKFTYSDGSTQIIPAYFAPMIAAAAQVDADAQAVEASRQQIVGIQANVQTLHDEADSDAQAVETSRQQIVGIQTDITNRQATIQTLHGEVDADAQSVEISRGIVQTHADNFEAQKDYFNAQLAEIDSDVVAIETSRQQMVGIQDDVVAKKAQIDQTKADNDVIKAAIDAKAVEVESKRVEVNSVTAQAANIVFNGSTDFPTVPPTFYWHCDQGELDPRIDLAYTGNLTVTDHRGVQRTVPQGARALDYDPVTRACLGFPVWEGRTNNVRNSVMQGAVVGVLGSGGAVPTNWTVTGITGGTREVVAIGKENGLDYIDLRYSGTLSDTQSNLYIDGIGPVSGVSAGQTWAGSVWVKLVAGSLANITGGYIKVRVEERDSAAGYLTQGDTNVVPNSTLSRYAQVRTLSNASVAKTGLTINVSYSPGSTIDLTLRIAAPQLELGAFATPYIPTSGAATLRGVMGSSIGGPAFQQFYNQNEGTLVIEFKYNTLLAGDKHLIRLVQSGNDWISIRTTSGTALRISIRETGKAQGDYTLITNLSPEVYYRIAFRIKASDFAASLNGAAILTSNSDALPKGITSVQVGGFDSSQAANATIREISYYPVGLPNAQLQALSRL